MKALVKNFLFGMFAFALTSPIVSAQKFGHLNYNSLIQVMPETKTAYDAMAEEQKTLMTKGQEIAGKFDADYQKYAQEVNEGKLSVIERQKREAALQKMQEDLNKFEQEAQASLEKKRQELLKPIVDKLLIAIKEVGKENSYQFIFDSSNGSVLHAIETEDVALLVRKKLGLAEK